MLKILMVITIMVFVVVSWRFSDLVISLGNLVGMVNSDFLAYIPIELRIIILLISLALIVGLAYAFIS